MVHARPGRAKPTPGNPPGATASLPLARHACFRGADISEWRRRPEAAEQGKRFGVEMTPKTVVDPDPVTELDDVLQKQIEELDIDLVVMASHVPGFRDFLFHANAGYLATPAEVSVFDVR